MFALLFVVPVRDVPCLADEDETPVLTSPLLLLVLAVLVFVEEAPSLCEVLTWAALPFLLLAD